MRLYLDEDAASPLLAKLLRKAAHEVQMPGEIGMLVGDLEIGDVAVDGQGLGLAVARLATVDLVAVDDQIADRRGQ